MILPTKPYTPRHKGKVERGVAYVQDNTLKGGWSVWNSLRRVRYKDRERQEALAALLTFLRRNSDRMDYPRYERAGWPISNGPMESFCKQLGRRLKGPGMRWSIGTVNPMAALVSLWSNEEWDTYWHPAAWVPQNANKPPPQTTAAQVGKFGPSMVHSAIRKHTLLTMGAGDSPGASAASRIIRCM